MDYQPTVTKRLTKEERLEALHDALEADLAAPLYQERVCRGQRIVFGEGKIDSQIMFIGEAPGAREAVFGRPFVGPAGHLLDDLLKLEKIHRRSVYITNLVKDHPPENRNPSPAEIDHYAHYLEQEIDILQPLLLVPMGKVPMEYVFRRFNVQAHNVRLTEMHGQVVCGEAHYGPVRIIPMLHPSSALYDSASLRTLARDFRVLRSVACELWLLD